jgi:carboxyl-terminal processing protease
MPDIYIPVDTAGYSDLYYELSGTGVLNDVLYNHLLKQNKIYQSTEEIIKNFRLSELDIKKIIQLATKRNVKVGERKITSSRKEIENQLRALLARYYFGDEGFYKALNSGDQAISRSLEVFKDAYKSADY